MKVKEVEYELIINSKKKFSLGFVEVAKYFELLYFFTWREIKVKYKQTFFGFLWLIIQPLFLTLAFTFFLGDSITKTTNLQIPYPLFALSGTIVWIFFSSSLSNAANSMVANSNIIKKVYFPRIIIPLSSILSSSLDFFISVILFFCIVWFFDVKINWIMIFVIPFIYLLLVFASLGFGLFLSALNIKYRDVRYALPFFIQGMMFLSPVMFPTNISDNDVVTFFLKINPITGALEIFRGIFYNYEVDISTVVYGFISTFILLIIGFIYFKKTENYFADLA